MFDRMNPALVAILASPFHWLVSRVLIQLTITDRSSAARPLRSGERSRSRTGVGGYTSVVLITPETAAHGGVSE
jgi:hypothetical protein